jgi:hypothetical protein
MFELINTLTGQIQVLSLADAAQAAKLDPVEIEWAIEECGMCSIDEYKIFALHPEEQAGIDTCQESAPGATRAWG